MNFDNKIIPNFCSDEELAFLDKFIVENTTAWNNYLNPNYQKAPSVGIPWLDGLCTFKVVRGGSWSHSVAYLRTKSRHQVHMRSKVDNLGFRVVNDFLN